MLSRLTSALTRFSARWVPSAFTIACALTVAIFVLGWTVGEATLGQTTKAWGDGFWTLLMFSMRMCMFVFAGYMLAVSAPMRWVLDKIASLPRSPTGAVVATALASMLIAWVHWGFGLIASAVLVGFMARRQPRADYRLLVAVSYFGLGATWHAGPSGSVPLLLATPGNFLIKKGMLAETVPMSSTIFTPFNLIFVAAVIVILAVLAALMHAPEDQRVTISEEIAAEVGRYDPPPRPAKPTPAEYIERFVGFNLLFGVVAAVWLVGHFRGGGALNFDVMNMIVLSAALVFHLRPVNVVHAAQQAVRPLHGIVLQFPLYAGMFGIIKSTALSKKLAHAFVSVATPRSFPLITFAYSALLNYFVPSGGSKWAIEAPYLLDAAKTLNVSVDRTAMAYAYGDMATNLIQPFWAIPLLSVARLEFKDILGYEAIAFFVYCVVSAVALGFLF